MNSVTIIGRLTVDPEPKIFQNGTTSTSFTVAVDRNYKDKEGKKITDFIPCQTMGNTAEFVNNYLSKGRLVAIEGSLQIDRYKDKEGNNKTFTKVHVNRIQALDKKDTGNFQPTDDVEVPF